MFEIGTDLFPLCAAVLSSLSCALLGNFLVLRRMSLMGDAISHAVLPGLVIAFLIASSRDPLVMMLGAGIAGVATVVLVEGVKRLGRVEPGAAMGVVFSVLFALGVLLIERASARHVDLDASCVLHGQLQTLVWWDADRARTLGELWSVRTLEAVPRQVWTLLAVCGVSLGFVTIFFKELRISAFDPALATTQGIHAGGMHYALMILVAGATVASFEAVGSILVIAMLICPAATARLLTDRLGSQLLWSAALAVLTAVLGYFGASVVPGALGVAPVNAAGSMAVVAGAMLMVAIVGAPRHGVVTRVLRRRSLARRVALDDLLAALYRAEEEGRHAVGIEPLRPLFVGRPLRGTISLGVSRGLVRRDGDGLGLTELGREDAREVVRRHRLWEHYLVDRAGLAPDHVHDPAEMLEHLGLSPSRGPERDPHGRSIP
ncbi:MAG: iron chelate uptake ABC transporter family permease subunit [Phycisphaerales bacterium]